jgi:hypothetical protein
MPKGVFERSASEKIRLAIQLSKHRHKNAGKNKKGKDISCANCGKIKYVEPYLIKKSKSGKNFCSKICANKFRAGISHTKEHKAKISKGLMGHKGVKFSEEVKKRMSENSKGRHTSPLTEFKKGRKHTDEHKQFMRQLMLQKIKDGTHPNWKGGRPNTLMLLKQYRIKKLGNGGSHTVGDWETLKAQYNWTCPCCGKQEPQIILTEDHIVPISKGGSDNIENIQPLCGSCNSKKGNRVTIKYKIKY